MDFDHLFKTPELRGYQVRAVGGCRTRMGRHPNGRGKRVILCMGTGSGKTYTASEIIRLTKFKQTKVTILCHRVEIMYQFHKSLEAFGIEHNILYKDKKVVGRVNLSMVQTYSRRYPQGLDEDLVVMDEVHMGNFETTLKRTSAMVIGLTATPIPSKPSYKLNQEFDDIVLPVKVSELIATNNLVRGVTYSVEHSFSHIKMKGGDFDTDQLVNEFRKTPKLQKGALENYLLHARGLRCLCFSASIAQSKEQCKLFNEAGVVSEHIDGETPDGERKAIFDRFKSGETTVLHNVNIATAGTDIPAVECVIQNFATTSIAKHHQVIGRGSRPFKGKEKFIIIDLGMNYARHGEYGDDVDWKAIFKTPSKDKSKKENGKKMPCPNCGAILTLPPLEEDGYRPIECHHCKEGKVEAKEVKEKVLETMTTTEIKDFKKKTLPMEIRGMPLSQMSHDQLISYGKHMGFSEKWANIRQAKRRSWR